MNNYINYYYHLYPKEIYQHPNFFYFKLQNDFYYFIPYNRPLLEIGPLYELTIRMLNINSLTHEIILNYLSQPVSFIDNKPYILFKRRLKEDKNLSLKDIIFFNQVHTNIQTNNLLNRSNWGELWSKKIDYFEEQISQVGKNYPLVRESINYFIGLA